MAILRGAHAGGALYGRRSASPSRRLVVTPVACAPRQAQYVWFSREVESLFRRGQAATLEGDGDTDPRAPSPFAPTTGGNTGPSRRGRPPRRPSAYPSAPVLRVVGGAEGGEGAEAAGEAPSYSQQNGLLAINMLLFEVSRFAPRAAQPRAPYPAASLPQHIPHAASSLAEAVRRGGGRVPLLLLCTLYMAVAQRLGLGLRLVSIRDEVQQLRQARGKARGEARTVRGRGAPAADEDDPTYDPEPTYLLQLPGTAEQRELYVDVRAEGRLRSTHDLAAFLHPSLRALPSDRIREFVTPLSHQTYCVQAPRPPAAHPHPPTRSFLRGQVVSRLYADRW